VTLSGLGEVLGEVPVPRGSWEREAVYASAAALKRGDGRAAEVAGEMAARLRALPGVSRADIRAGGFLLIEVAVPGEIVREILDGAAETRVRTKSTAQLGEIWPDFPRTWNNPGFVVRYAYARAAAVQRWARDLEFDGLDIFRPDLLTGIPDRRVLRVLAEWPSRRLSGDPAWPAYLERLADAYHDAHEQAPAIPKGDEMPGELHIARLWLARAVQRVLGEGMRACGEIPLDRL
jgi:arginyl-tRNA synthetase